MCRWAAYIGPAIFLEEVVSAPERSLVAQSLRAREAATEVNGDGFGLAWYGERPEPGLFREPRPAWSDPNLKSLASQIRSGLFLAHVRASTGAPPSRVNCHPFVRGRWSFMHNGKIGGYAGALKRRLDLELDDSHYGQRQGATDSETFFLLALQNGLADEPKAALERTVGLIERLASEHRCCDEPALRMTVAVADGERLYAARYASDGRAPTLYHRASARFGGRAVVSEPLDDAAEAGRCWEAAPEACFVEVTPARVEVAPFTPRSA